MKNFLVHEAGRTLSGFIQRKTLMTLVKPQNVWI